MAIDRDTVIRLAREAVNSGDGSELTGDAIERFAQLVFLESVPDQTPGEVLLQRAYEKGWIQCATWAEREDLIADCDSPAYVRERDAVLEKLARGVSVLTEPHAHVLLRQALAAMKDDYSSGEGEAIAAIEAYLAGVKGAGK